MGAAWRGCLEDRLKNQPIQLWAFRNLRTRLGCPAFLQQAIQKPLQGGLWRESSRDLLQASSFNKNQQIKKIKTPRKPAWMLGFGAFDFGLFDFRLIKQREIFRACGTGRSRAGHPPDFSHPPCPFCPVDASEAGQQAHGEAITVQATAQHHRCTDASQPRPKTYENCR